MFDILEGILDDTLNLLLLAVVVVAVISVLLTYSKTRSLVATLGAILMGAIVIYGVNNMESGDTIGDAVEDDIDRRED